MARYQPRPPPINQITLPPIGKIETSISEGLFAVINTGVYIDIENYINRNNMSANVRQSITDRTPVHVALLIDPSLADQLNILDIVRLLFDKQSPIHTPDYQNNWQIHFAIDKQYDIIVKYLVSKGAKLSEQDAVGNNGLQVAVIGKTINCPLENDDKPEPLITYPADQKSNNILNELIAEITKLMKNDPGTTTTASVGDDLKQLTTIIARIPEADSDAQKDLINRVKRSISSTDYQSQTSAQQIQDLENIYLDYYRKMNTTYGQFLNQLNIKSDNTGFQNLLDNNEASLKKSLNDSVDDQKKLVSGDQTIKDMLVKVSAKQQEIKKTVNDMLFDGVFLDLTSQNITGVFLLNYYFMERHTRFTNYFVREYKIIADPIDYLETYFSDPNANVVYIYKDNEIAPVELGTLVNSDLYPDVSTNQAQVIDDDFSEYGLNDHDQLFPDIVKINSSGQYADDQNTFFNLSMNDHPFLSNESINELCQIYQLDKPNNIDENLLKESWLYVFCNLMENNEYFDDHQFINFIDATAGYVSTYEWYYPNNSLMTRKSKRSVKTRINDTLAKAKDKSLYIYFVLLDGLYQYLNRTDNTTTYDISKFQSSPLIHTNVYSMDTNFIEQMTTDTNNATVSVMRLFLQYVQKGLITIVDNSLQHLLYDGYEDVMKEELLTATVIPGNTFYPKVNKNQEILSASQIGAYFKKKIDDYFNSDDDKMSTLRHSELIPIIRKIRNISEIVQNINEDDLFTKITFDDAGNIEEPKRNQNKKHLDLYLVSDILSSSLASSFFDKEMKNKIKEYFKSQNDNHDTFYSHLNFNYDFVLDFTQASDELNDFVLLAKDFGLFVSQEKIMLWNIHSKMIIIYQILIEIRTHIIALSYIYTDIIHDINTDFHYFIMQIYLPNFLLIVVKLLELRDKLRHEFTDTIKLTTLLVTITDPNKLTSINKIIDNYSSGLNKTIKDLEASIIKLMVFFNNVIKYLNMVDFLKNIDGNGEENFDAFLPEFKTITSNLISNPDWKTVLNDQLMSYMYNFSYYIGGSSIDIVFPHYSLNYDCFGEKIESMHKDHPIFDNLFIMKPFKTNLSEIPDSIGILIPNFDDNIGYYVYTPQGQYLIETTNLLSATVLPLKNIDGVEYENNVRTIPDNTYVTGYMIYLNNGTNDMKLARYPIKNMRVKEIDGTGESSVKFYDIDELTNIESDDNLDPNDKKLFYTENEVPGHSYDLIDNAFVSNENNKFQEHIPGIDIALHPVISYNDDNYKHIISVDPLRIPLFNKDQYIMNDFAIGLYHLNLDSVYSPDLTPMITGSLFQKKYNPVHDAFLVKELIPKYLSYQYQILVERAFTVSNTPEINTLLNELSKNSITIGSDSNNPKLLRIIDQILNDIYEYVFRNVANLEIYKVVEPSFRVDTSNVLNIKPDIGKMIDDVYNKNDLTIEQPMLQTNLSTLPNRPPKDTIHYLYHGDFTRREKMSCYQIDQQLIDYIIKTNSQLVNQQNKLGDTPLHIATQIKNLPLVVTLLKNNAIQLKNQQGKTPRDIIFSELNDHLRYFSPDGSSEIDTFSKSLNTVFLNNLQLDNYKNNIIENMMLVVPITYIIYQQQIYYDLITFRNGFTKTIYDNVSKIMNIGLPDNYDDMINIDKTDINSWASLIAKPNVLSDNTSKKKELENQLALIVNRRTELQKLPKSNRLDNLIASLTADETVLTSKISTMASKPADVKTLSDTKLAISSQVIMSTGGNSFKSPTDYYESVISNFNDPRIQIAIWKKYIQQLSPTMILTVMNKHLLQSLNDINQVNLYAGFYDTLAKYESNQKLYGHDLTNPFWKDDLDATIYVIGLIITPAFINLLKLELAKGISSKITTLDINTVVNDLMTHVIPSGESAEKYITNTLPTRAYKFYRKRYDSTLVNNDPDKAILSGSDLFTPIISALQLNDKITLDSNSDTIQNLRTKFIPWMNNVYQNTIKIIALTRNSMDRYVQMTDQLISMMILLK